MSNPIKEYIESSVNKSITSLTEKANIDFNSKYGPSSSGGKEKFEGKLIPGKIYLFDYFTETEISKKNSFINYRPLSMFCETKDSNGELIDFFIDFNVIPSDYKNTILERIYLAFKGDIEYNMEEDGKNPIDVRYSSIKNLLSGTGFEFAYTGFRRSFMRNIRIIDYKDWGMVAFTTSNKIKGDPVNEIYRKYRAKMNS